MTFIADLHLHSHFSRACSGGLNPENLNVWAQLKGVTVIGTGDFTHPGWFDELRDKLEEAEPGLFRLRPEFARLTAESVPKSCRAEVRFLLTTEISSIYKKGDKTRKVHNVVLVPGFQAAAKLGSELAKVGNIASDGRPILGLDCRNLLEIVLETAPEAFLVPAHIWTPHFSVLGAASEFNSIEECFEDLTGHIFAVETGLSSDPPMNWRLSALDRCALLSNSDAHSPAKLMREANVFDCPLSYSGIREALQSRDPGKWLGTVEFFPEEGKYHFDGHRKCQQRLSPAETLKHGGKCPVCGKKVTVGVLHRVESLADRKDGFRPPGAAPFRNLVPLPEILGEVFQQGEETKRVQNEYFRLLDRFGNEHTILTATPLVELSAFSSPLLAKAIRRLRTGTVEALAGYDGEYGVIRTLRDADRQTDTQQLDMFGAVKPESPLLQGLNPMQREAVEAPDGPLLLVAGAGTGKTSTLTRRLAYGILERGQKPEAILAVTFTQKAAAEVLERLTALLEDERLSSRLQVGTIHGVSARLLRLFGDGVGVPSEFRVADETIQLALAKEALEAAGGPADLRPAQLLDAIAALKYRQPLNTAGLAAQSPLEGSGSDSCSEDALRRLFAAYQDGLARRNALDFEDLILKSTELFRHPEAGPSVCSRFVSVLVDEAQDLNDAQYAWLRALTADHNRLTLVGDPDQSIYAFRGSNARIFRRFLQDYPDATLLRLEENYRSPETVLEAAEQLITHDPERLPKRLFTGRSGGRKVQFWECETSRIEAARVVAAIEEMVEETSMERRDAKGPELPLAGIARGFDDIAILTRTNAQHFVFADALKEAGIPFQSAAAVRKKPQPEIRELLALLRLAASSKDAEALEYLLLSTVRGVGEKTVESLRAAAADKGVSVFEALEGELAGGNWRPDLQQSVARFLAALNDLKAQLERDGLVAALRQRLAQAGLLEESRKDPDALFLQLLAARDGGGAPGQKPAAGLQDFLADAALRLESDVLDPRAESVKLLTIHAAKGLEFPVVFVGGLEEGLLPVSEAKDSPETLQEERRLLYVAMTRARELLILTRCRSRFLYGSEKPVSASRFTQELPVERFERQTFERRISKRRQMENAQLRLF
jgi:uncharacterized protein (TIGR00375 family)